MDATVGELLREHRLAAGLTQETLAERAGISARSIQAIERGTNKPHRDTVERLAEALGLPQGERARLLAEVTPAPRRRVPPDAASETTLAASVETPALARTAPSATRTAVPRLASG